MGRNTTSLVKQRQAPLREQYAKTPARARIFDGAHTVNACSGDPFHGAVVPNHGPNDSLRFGIHRAVGGDHDLPNPGDLLCAALAACLDATIRMIADHFGVKLASLQVKVAAECDVRGCLMVEPDVPVGFQRLHCSVRLSPHGDADKDDLHGLLAAAEKCCVVMQTLRNGVTVLTELEAIDSSAPEIALSDLSS